MSFQIKEAGPEDKETVLALRVNGVQDSFANYQGDRAIIEDLISELASETRVEEDISNPDKHLLLALKDDEVVGTAVLDIKDNQGELRSCFCQLKGQGVGSALLHARVDIAREKGLDKVWIETDTINPGGIAHAERHGFKAVASRAGKRIKDNEVITYQLDLS